MSLTDSMGNFSLSDIAAVVKDNDGFGGNGAWWLIILMLFFTNGGWNNGYNAFNAMNGCNCGTTVQEGLDHNAVMNAIGGVSASNANILQTLNNLAMNQAQNCFGITSGINDLKYTMASESCATRAAANENTQAILAKLSQQELEAKNDTINMLRDQLNMATLSASQLQQTIDIKSSLPCKNNCGC